MDIQESSASTTVNNLPINNATLPSQQIPIEPHTNPWIVILLIIIFQPIAWYLMYKEKRYHRWFSYLLWLDAGAPLFAYAMQVIFVIPQLETLYKNLNVPHSYTNFYIASAILIIPSVAEIIVGIMLFKKTKKPNISYNKLLKIAIILLIINLLSAGYALGYSILSIITPIYSLTNSIK